MYTQSFDLCILFFSYLTRIFGSTLITSTSFIKHFLSNFSNIFLYAKLDNVLFSFFRSIEHPSFQLLEIQVFNDKTLLLGFTLFHDFNGQLIQFFISFVFVFSLWIGYFLIRTMFPSILVSHSAIWSTLISIPTAPYNVSVFGRFICFSNIAFTMKYSP